MKMFKNLRKRAEIPFQGFKEVTFPPKAVCGFGSPYGSIPPYPYVTLNGQPSTEVDPIQVGPTG
jgi:hypothetical protein